MISIIFEILFALLKKLYRFVGPALIVAIVLVTEIIAMPEIADNKAQSEALHRETNEILSFEEVRYDEKAMDRVFRAVLKNNGSDPTIIGSMYITDEKGKSIFNSIKTEYEDLRIAGKHVTLGYIPPGCECTVEIWIDDYKLEGLDHIYITDLYSGEKRGRRFDIEKK